MRRIAAHFIFWKQLYTMGYIELAGGIFKGVYPLEAELPSTEFYDGLLVPVLAGTTIPPPYGIEGIRQSGITDAVDTGSAISLFHIHNNTTNIITL